MVRRPVQALQAQRAWLLPRVPARLRRWPRAPGMPPAVRRAGAPAAGPPSPARLHFQAQA